MNIWFWNGYLIFLRVLKHPVGQNEHILTSQWYGGSLTTWIPLSHRMRSISKHGSLANSTLTRSFNCFTVPMWSTSCHSNHSWISSFKLFDFGVPSSFKVENSRYYYDLTQQYITYASKVVMLGKSLRAKLIITVNILHGDSFRGKQNFENLSTNTEVMARWIVV